MRYRRGNIRSHRAKRRKIVAPWIVVTAVITGIIAGLTTGFYILLRQNCSGQVSATVVASPEMVNHLETLARGWADGSPSVDGKCASVDIESKDSAAMAQALGASWDPKAGGPPPDVWVPDSSVWARRASASLTAASILPQLQPTLARTPNVIAMPRPMAAALGWPKTSLTWQSLVNDFAGTSNGWGRYGKAQWGDVRIGMTNPTKSTAGLLALMAMSGADYDGTVGKDGQATIDRLKRIRAVYHDSTDQILSELTKEDRQGSDAALKYLSAFPALEQDIVSYNVGNPTVPLVAVYPSDGSADADYPYLILKAPWSKPDREKVAQEFLKYLRGPDGRKEFLDSGYRDANRAPGKELTEDNGVSPKILTLPRVALLPEAVEHTVDTWNANT